MKRWLFASALIVLPAFSQPASLIINPGTPDGAALQAIASENDEAKKVALEEDFVAKYPKSEGAGWVGSLLAAAYVQQKAYDKALEAADKVYSGNPGDLDLGFNAVKAAEGKGDVETVKKWATHTEEVAKKITAKAPANDDDKQLADHAKEVASYAEYSLYGMALRSKDTKQIVDLGETLLQLNAKSPYMWLISDRYLAALGPKGCSTAAKLSADDSKNAEAWLFQADCSWRGQAAAAVIGDANKALEALNTRAKVDGGNEATKIGLANFFVGTGNALQQRWGPADKALRVALPSVKSGTYGGYALFYLGLANYSLGKAIGDRAKEREALGFFEQSAGMKSAVQDQAARNVATIKAELGVK